MLLDPRPTPTQRTNTSATPQQFHNSGYKKYLHTFDKNNYIPKRNICDTSSFNTEPMYSKPQKTYIEKSFNSSTRLKKN